MKTYYKPQLNIWQLQSATTLLTSPQGSPTDLNNDVQGGEGESLKAPKIV